jgi:hypothetical protein
MKRILGVSLALAVLAVAPGADAQKQRAVRVPAPPCSFSLSFAFADPIPDAGLAGGRITVTPSAPTCTSWGTYSPVDWISFATESTTNATITVTPNPTTSVRSAQVRVAGVDFNITQQGRVDPPFVELGIVKNGSFNVDLANWGWQDRFPNGVGTATWAAVDANNAAGSGSMQLRNTAVPGPGMQRLQCVSVTSGALYTFSFAYRMPPSGGLAQVSVFDLETDDCTGPYALRFTRQYFPNGTQNWRRDSEIFRMAFAARSALIVFASKTQTNSGFDVNLDDVALKQE